MVGKGRRFHRSGYNIYKPFILVDGVPMVQKVIEAFPQHVRRHVITAKGSMTAEQEKLLENRLNCHLIYIADHDDGPAYSIFKVLSQLPLDESFFFAYCDVTWSWKYNDLEAMLQQNDGIVFTHTGFHPHLVNNKHSGFCLPDPDKRGYLSCYREKSSFTDNWMKEPVSIGVYFIRCGQSMANDVCYLIDNDERVNGELFPSLVFNYMVARGERVKIHDVEFFAHLGVPEQLEDYLNWNVLGPRLREPEKISPVFAWDNVMMMGGSGSRMKSVSDIPKPFLPVDGMSMYKSVLQRLPSRQSTIITNSDMAEMIKSQDIDPPSVVLLKEKTRSQYETLLVALDFIVLQKTFFLSSCDAWGIFDSNEFANFLKIEKPEVVIFIFRPSLIHKKLKQHHSHVTVEQGRVLDVHVKSISSESDFGFAGFFWINDGSIFKEAKFLVQTSSHEMIIDDVFKKLVSDGRVVKAFEIESYIHLGTPEEYLEYEFWMKHVDRSASLN